MREPKLYDAVRLTIDLLEDGLRAGDVGTIVLTFDKPTVAYEVEFTDDLGRTRASRVLTSAEFAVVE